jgi:hypothetical protein
MQAGVARLQRRWSRAANSSCWYPPTTKSYCQSSANARYRQAPWSRCAQPFRRSLHCQYVATKPALLLLVSVLTAASLLFGSQCEVMVLVYDEDFEEWVLLNKLEDLPDKAKVQIKRKDE